MATHAPVHPSSAISAPLTERPAVRQASAAAVRTVILTVGVVAVWMGTVLGFQQISEHVFGLSDLDAWALSVGLITYFALFIGFIVGAILLVRRADDNYLDAGK